MSGWDIYQKSKHCGETGAMIVIIMAIYCWRQCWKSRQQKMIKEKGSFAKIIEERNQK